MKIAPERIAISCTKSVEFLDIKEIVRFEGFQNYTKVFLRNGKMILSSNKLGNFKTHLEKRGFYSCHKSHVINLALLDRYMKEGYVVMNDKSSVPVSRRKKTEFLNRVLNIVENPTTLRIGTITNNLNSISA